MTPALGDIIMIDGKRTHVLDIGQGPAVVLLHGASGNLRDFTFSLTDRLKDRYRIIAFDRPGLGYSEALTAAGDSPQLQARHLAKVLDSKGISKAVVVGHSFGGSVAMAWALERPDQVAAVVTLGGAVMPWPGKLSSWYGIASSGFGSAAIVPVAVALTPRSIAGRVVSNLFKPNPPPDGYLEYIGVDLTLRTPVIRANTRQINNLKGHLQVMSEQYPSVRIPVEILHGDADDIVPPSVHAEGMHALLPESRLTLLPETGHMPQHSQPEATVAAIDRAALRGGLR